MKTRLLQLLTGCLLLLASASGHASDEREWLETQMNVAMNTAASWKVDRPALVVTGTEYIEVAGDGRIYVGLPLITRLRRLDNGEQLTRFLLLHEIQHVIQRKLSREPGALALECESDYFAVLLLAREILSKSTNDTRNSDLSRVLSIQGLPVSAGALSLNGSSEGHLPPKDRFKAGAFASWRAIYETLTSPELSTLKRYAEVRNRAKGFVEPADKDVEVWARNFCNAATLTSSISSSLWIMASTVAFVTDAPDGVSYFDEMMEVENKTDRAIRLQAWPLLGLRPKKQTPDFETAGAVSAAYVDLTIPAKGKAKTNYRSYFPLKELPGMEIFRWSSTFDDGFIATTQALGERLEPPNCARGWKPPQDPDLASFYQFVQRAGSLATRQFEGLLGPPRFAAIADSHHDWASLPALALREDSYLVLKTGNTSLFNTSGTLSLIETPDAEKARAVFANHAQVFRSICAGNERTLRESSDADGGRTLTVGNLTLSSSASLYLSVNRDRKEPSKPAIFSVSWVIRPKE